jgi:hypothetical protein
LSALGGAGLGRLGEGVDQAEPVRGGDRGQRGGLGRVVHVAEDQVAAVGAGAGGHQPLDRLGLAAAAEVVGLLAGHRVLAEGDELALEVVVEHGEQPRPVGRVEDVDLQQVPAEHRLGRVLGMDGVLVGGDRPQRQLAQYGQVDQAGSLPSTRTRYR